jgi:hypothetical protein
MAARLHLRRLWTSLNPSWSGATASRGRWATMTEESRGCSRTIGSARHASAKRPSPCLALRRLRRRWRRAGAAYFSLPDAREASDSLRERSESEKCRHSADLGGGDWKGAAAGSRRLDCRMSAACAAAASGGRSAASSSSSTASQGRLDDEPRSILLRPRDSGARSTAGGSVAGGGVSATGGLVCGRRRPERPPAVVGRGACACSRRKSMTYYNNINIIFRM